MAYIVTVGSTGMGLCLGHGPNGSPVPAKVFVTRGSAKMTINGMKVCVVTDKVQTTCPRCGRGTVTKGISKVTIEGKKPVSTLPSVGIKLHGRRGSKVFKLSPIFKKVSVPII